MLPGEGPRRAVASTWTELARCREQVGRTPVVLAAGGGRGWALAVPWRAGLGMGCAMGTGSISEGAAGEGGRGDIHGVQRS